MQVIDPNNEVGTVGIQGAIDSYDVEDFGGCDDIYDGVSVGESSEPVVDDDVVNLTKEIFVDKASSSVSASLPDCKYRINS